MSVKKTILDLCGGTGSWSKPYADAGYKVINITLPEWDVTDAIVLNESVIFQSWHGGKHHSMEVYYKDIHGILVAPPCTMFSDARTNAKTPRDLRGAMKIVKACLDIIEMAQYRIASDQSKMSPLKSWALENPWYGRLKWFIGNPNFVFDPWEFGDGYKKRTALWGYFNQPKKTHTDKPEIGKFDKLLMVDLKNLKGVNNSDYWKQTKLRQTLRSITPQGFAKAFYEANK